jgi:hypothetical protein
MFNWGLQTSLPILVGGIPTPLKNMKVNWDDDIPKIWKKSCSKQPTSKGITGIHMHNVATMLQSGAPQCLLVWPSSQPAWLSWPIGGAPINGLCG